MRISTEGRSYHLTRELDRPHGHVTHFAGLRKATIEKSPVKNHLPAYIGVGAVSQLVH
jgi:hypothetical protein